jgi:hypothetical protein
MKKTAAFLFIGAIAELLSLVSPVTAGVFTLTDGPNFTPPSAFNNNTIEVDTIVVGGLMHVQGGTTISSAETDSAIIDLSGDYSADARDVFSIAFSFTANLNMEAPIPYRITGAGTDPSNPFGFSYTGMLLPGLHRYEGMFASTIDIPVATAGTFSGSLQLDFGGGAAPSAVPPGTVDLNIQQIDFQLDPLPATVIEPPQSQNISTRANVGTGDNVLIGGIIITGNDTKQVVVRGIGPSLTGAGVTDALADPILELHDSTGAIIATNDNWMDNSEADRMILIDNNLAPGSDLESALVVNPSPGAYTAIVRGVGDTTGVALVEAYDLDNGTTDSQLANISTRGFVGTGEDVMIGGFILGGGGGAFAQIIVRGIGPSLADFGVADPLADPFLELHNADGDVVASNDNWMDDPNMQTVADRGLAPSEPNESAIYEVLPSGAYTAILSGVGDTTGIGLVETYDVDIGVGPANP